MRREISGNTGITGVNMIFVLLALMLLVGICVADFSIRWVQWCNVSDAPFSDAVKNVALLCVGALAITFSASEYISSKYIWQVVILYSVFFCTIPTAVFFTQYLIANALLAVAMFYVSRIKNTLTSRVNILLASFLIGMAMWWVPLAVLFMAVVYTAVMLFSAGDLKSWIVPLVGLSAAAVVVAACRMFFMGEIDFISHITWVTFFSMPYTEKVFKSYNFYFYVSIIGAICFLAYMKYVKMASNDTLPEKKLSILLSVMLIVAVLSAVLVPKSRYMIVFSSLPFAFIMTKYYTQYASKTWGVVMRWILVIMAIVSLLLFK
ncbi:MAG: hypothetical protein PHD21_01805 [Flavobacteriales bacterium]|nr:hypothetical protein [Flavobacteriales bacterium]